MALPASLVSRASHVAVLLAGAVLVTTWKVLAFDQAVATPAGALGGALETFASHGPIGAVALIAMYVAWKKDVALRDSERLRLTDRDACAAELAKERQARLDDAKAWLAQALQLSEKSYANADKLASVAETLTAVKRGGT